LNLSLRIYVKSIEPFQRSRSERGTQRNWKKGPALKPSCTQDSLMLTIITPEIIVLASGDAGHLRNPFISYRAESCQQLRKLVLNHVVSIKRRLTLLRMRNHHLHPRRSLGVSRANVTFRSKSFSAVSAILTSTKSVTSGARCPLSIHAFQDTRLSVVSPRSAPQSPSLSPGMLLQ
jgi:hypothetical protein